MTAYQGQLDKYRQILVHNHRDQTQITLQSSRPGQQQSQGSGLRTGQWTAPPSLFKLESEFVLRLEGREGQTFVEISPGGVQTLNAAPSLVGAQVQPLQPVEPPQMDASMPKMEPMKPMRMEMGDMMMDMDSSQMTMGGSGGFSGSNRLVAGQPGARLSPGLLLLPAGRAAGANHPLGGGTASLPAR